MYTDLLTRIQNAVSARKETLKVPFSKMDMAILELLTRYKYVEEIQKKGRMPKRIIEIKLRTAPKGEKVIQGVRFLSTPSKRSYMGYRKLRSVKQGYGLAILSTPKGILSSQEAKKQKVGGQILFEIW